MTTELILSKNQPIHEQELRQLLHTLVSQPTENEWLEFKENFHSNKEIGERLSALSNGACLRNKPYGYFIFGVEDKTHAILGTTFRAKTAKKGNEDLKNWLIRLLDPRIDFEVFEFNIDTEKQISLYKITAASGRPTRFENVAYVRVGSYTNTSLTKQ